MCRLLRGRTRGKRPNMEMDALDSILKGRDVGPEDLIEVLQDVQTQYNYLPENVLRAVSDRLHVPLIEVFRGANFYRAFSLAPRGRHQITVCMGTACHVRGSKLVLEEMERQVGVKAGGTTENLEYTLERVNCVGACALGPVVICDGKYHGKLKLTGVAKVLKATKKDEQ
jgi:NADH-quinone oxidoreductase subunit E